jgi:acyl carrier protein
MTSAINPEVLVQAAIPPIALAVPDPSSPFLEPIQTLLRKLTFQEPGPDTDLLATGLLDSMALVQLVGALEREFAVEIPMNEVGAESFRSAASIASLVANAKTAEPPLAGAAGASACESRTPAGPPPGLILEIQSLIEETFSVRVESADQDLFASGALDSLILVQLILRLEERFGLDLVMEDLDLDSFATMSTIAAFLETSLKKGRLAAAGEVAGAATR